jgi:hypothetical protein
MNTPEHIVELEDNEIFVFGSNYAGRHGKGAALTAKRLFGATQGQGTGRMGRCYAIPTKGHKMEVLSLEHIRAGVGRFLVYAEHHPELRFLVTPIGCGLAGYKPKEIAPMFHYAPGNVILPRCFVEG